MTVALLAAAGLLTAVAMVLWRLRRFRAALAAALAASPDLRVAASTPFGVTVAVSGFPVRIHLGRAVLTPSATPEMLANALRAAVPAVPVPPLPLVQNRILPVLRRTDRLPPAEGYRPGSRVVRVPFDGNVVIAYVIEGQFRMTFVTAGMLEAWAMDAAGVHVVALENLRAKTAHVLMEIGGPQAEYVALDGYDAARALAADMLIPPGVTNPVFAIPHEHALLIAPGDDEARLRREAEQAYRTAPLPLSPALYRWSPTGPERLGAGSS